MFTKPTSENCSLVHTQVKITVHYPVNIDIGFGCEDNYLIKDGDYYTTEHIFIISGNEVDRNLMFHFDAVRREQRNEPLIKRIESECASWLDNYYYDELYD